MNTAHASRLVTASAAADRQIYSGRVRSLCHSPSVLSRAEPLIDGRYKILDRIGLGATAAVYHATDLLLDRDVALKVLHGCFADDSGFIERFQREAPIAARLPHQNIVTVYHRSETGGLHYVAMEYVPGSSLKSLIRARAPLTPPAAIALIAQLLQAAWYIHNRGIVHRDIKPDNAIVATEGHLKLTDFGVARPNESAITSVGTVIGTAPYLSPEQAEGRAAGVQSDLYSIGIILYELLAGRVPFYGDTVASILLKHVRVDPISLRTLNAAVTPELDGVVMRSLARDGGCRFADAGAFISALADASGMRLHPLRAASTWFRGPEMTLGARRPGAAGC